MQRATAAPVPRINCSSRRYVRRETTRQELATSRGRSADEVTTDDESQHEGDRMKTNKLPLWTVCAALAFAALAGCGREGTMERAGEEVDEAVDTLKRGEESTSTKIDDAMDEARDGINDAADEIRDN